MMMVMMVVGQSMKWSASLVCNTIPKLVIIMLYGRSRILLRNILYDHSSDAGLGYVPITLDAEFSGTKKLPVPVELQSHSN